MAEPAHGIVQDFAGRERLMPALVGQDPQSGAEETLDHRVQKPETSPERSGRNDFGGDETIEEVEGGGQRDDVSSDIVEASGGRPLKAMLGDGFVDVTNGIVGDFEGIPICVHELRLLGDTRLFLGAHLLLGKRRQGRRRGRSSRTIERGDVGGRVGRGFGRCRPAEGTARLESGGRHDGG